MRAGFKNAADSEKYKAIGVLSLTQKLEIITGEEFLAGRAWVKAEHAARHMKNLGKENKYETAVNQACSDFDNYFQEYAGG